MFMASSRLIHLVMAPISTMTPWRAQLYLNAIFTHLHADSSRKVGYEALEHDEIKLNGAALMPPSPGGQL
jgi:hypothetical protein